MFTVQCARRWFDEGDTNHLVNLGKYVSAMLAAGAKVAYEKDESLASLTLLVAVSSTATVYQLYWDFVKDWGLLQPNSKNPWLRNDVILKRKYMYYLSMVCSSSAHRRARADKFVKRAQMVSVQTFQLQCRLQNKLVVRLRHQRSKYSCSPLVVKNRVPKQPKAQVKCSHSCLNFLQGLNLVLRLAWLQTVIHPNFGSLDSRVTSFLLAALEVIRRGHWNFYR